MVTVMSLWLPILLAAVFVFVVAELGWRYDIPTPIANSQ